MFIHSLAYSQPAISSNEISGFLVRMHFRREFFNSTLYFVLSSACILRPTWQQDYESLTSYAELRALDPKVRSCWVAYCSVLVIDYDSIRDNSDVNPVLMLDLEFVTLESLSGAVIWACAGSLYSNSYKNFKLTYWRGLCTISRTDVIERSLWFVATAVKVVIRRTGKFGQNSLSCVRTNKWILTVTVSGCKEPGEIVLVKCQRRKEKLNWFS